MGLRLNSSLPIYVTLCQLAQSEASKEFNPSKTSDHVRELAQVINEKIQQ